GERIVGTVHHSDYPPVARFIPRVGGYDNLDLERIVALEPDLVIAWKSGNTPGEVARLERLGLPVYYSEPRTLDDIARALERLGELAGTAERARAAAQEFRAHRRVLERRYAGRPPVSVFYQIWHSPLMTVNGEHVISDVIRLCGGRNVFADLSSLSPTVSIEAVLAADPEAVVASGMGEERPEWLDEWRGWPGLAAVEHGNLFFIPPDLLQRHGPRILQGAERLCRRLERARGE
ncbi:MAG: cobalamin-binding protein, partial [Gammaproteobacteria bacterium]|nr:cobalamin-binding protein [Gammaproteobacteria bacterium]